MYIIVFFLNKIFLYLVVIDEYFIYIYKLSDIILEYFLNSNDLLKFNVFVGFFGVFVLFFIIFVVVYIYFKFFWKNLYLSKIKESEWLV